jgi:hypothetical protein
VLPINSHEVLWIRSTRELLAAGELASRAAGAPEQRPQLRAAVIAIVSPVVFQVLTKPLELKRGHRACASSVQRMEADCYDAYNDDVGDVADWILEHAVKPVGNLEAWIAPRVKPITVDAHRRWRGERGAQQRPRVPKWLIALLAEDAWKVHLAKVMLIWVGVSTNAGGEVWPIGDWAQRRAVAHGETVPSERETRRDVEAVLAAMQTRPAWFEKYIERPLGRKEIPLYSVPRIDFQTGEDPLPLELVPLDQRDEAALIATAAAAVEQIVERVAGGEPANAVVADVLFRVFTEDGLADGMAQVPGAAPSDAERVRHLIADRADLERIVGAVVAVLNLNP